MLLISRFPSEIYNGNEKSLANNFRKDLTENLIPDSSIAVADTLTTPDH